tara:strand:+ start:21 stop:194 length:174 start_codon:yes stop_codon:yes gene_type:complete
MKIFIEDYNGNDLCSFEVPVYFAGIYAENNCSIADVDIDENGNEYIRIQLEVRPLEI